MLELKTEVLQKMVNKSIHGASNNKLIPLTSYVSVSWSPSVLHMLTTDGMNYLEVATTLDGVEADAFTAVVRADTFAKLVRKLSGDSVKLDLSDKYLVVESGGTYKLELLLDDDDNPVPFRMPFDNLVGKEKLGDIDRETINRVMTSLKPSLAVSTAQPHYCCYRVGDEIIATDTSLISVLNKKVFDVARLISAECMNLLDVITADGASVSAYKVEDAVVFVSGSDCLFTRVPAGIENYNADAIKGFTSSDFPYHCTLSVGALIDTLERIALFIGEYDAGAVNFAFDADGVTISSKNTSGVEQVQYETNDQEDEYTCIMDINSALTVFKAQTSQVVDVYYGADQTIKIVDGDLVTIVALMY